MGVIGEAVGPLRPIYCALTMSIGPLDTERMIRARPTNFGTPIIGTSFQFFTRMVSICVYPGISLFRQDLGVGITSYEP